MTRARHWAILLLAAGLVMALAGGLAACGGPADGALPPPESPPSPAATPESAVAPVEPPATATLPPTAASSSPPATIPESPPAPGGPPVPDAPAPAATATSEPAAAPVESPTGDPSAATDEAEATSLLYDTYDRSGAVAEPGHYAFLADPADPASVVTAYEELRDGTVTALWIHTHDAHGVPQADLYDAVEAGDLVEWRQAADCFVRYQVTAGPDPAAPTAYREVGVAWMTYAYAGCTGAIDPNQSATLAWGDLPNLGGPTLTTPIVHGSFQLIPENWEGAIESHEIQPPPASTIAAFDAIAATWTDRARTEERAAELPYWRTPRLPEDWQLLGAGIYRAITPYGYVALWRGPRGAEVEIDGAHADSKRWRRIAATGLHVRHTLVIAGRPAYVHYRPTDLYPIVGVVYIYDPAMDAEYRVFASGGSRAFPDIDTLIAIAASLFEPPNPP
ncbi:MAG: hypothetical protein OXG19_04805 [Chloroflexi bacterium]|nr:hypothetical protein [Chloroflexota bacterium]